MSDVELPKKVFLSQEQPPGWLMEAVDLRVTRDQRRGLWSKACFYSRMTKIDSMDLFQAGCLALLETGAYERGVFAMRNMARIERQQRSIKCDFALVAGMFRKRSATFTDIDEAIASLNAENKMCVEMWLDGHTYSDIARATGLPNSNYVKRRLVWGFKAIGKHFGNDEPDLQKCFEDTSRTTPQNIHWIDGKYQVQVGAGSKYYLGRFDDLEEAIKVRDAHPRFRKKKEYVAKPIREYRAKRRVE